MLNTKAQIRGYLHQALRSARPTVPRWANLAAAELTTARTSRASWSLWSGQLRRDPKIGLAPRAPAGSGLLAAGRVITCMGIFATMPAITLRWDRFPD